MTTVGDPMIGRTVAHYEILSRVGGGGMGVVYRARNIKLGHLVALKFLPQQWSHDDVARQRFQREAQAASATNHPSICTIHDIEEAEDGQLFIVMAYYEGETLKARLARGRLPIDEALDIATQVADGLAKAHAQGVVHRDIKPGNLMLTEDGVRILDFGLATFADALKLTIENSMLGTAAYMSPEQVRGQQADARADVWALGVVLYEMLTGRVPFQGSHAEAIAYAVRHESPAPIRAERPEVPEEVEQLVFRALHKEPSVRYASGRDLARALRQVRGQSLPLDLRTEPVPAPRPPDGGHSVGHRLSRRLLASAAIAAVLAAMLFVWALFPVPRAEVAVAPVVNLSGYSTLDPYTFALTEDLTSQLRNSRSVLPVPASRVRLILRRFRQSNLESISRAALEPLATHSGAPTLLVPALVVENGVWRGRVEVRNAKTATNEAVLWTPPVTSALLNDTALSLMSELATQIERYFVEQGPRRGRVFVLLERLIHRAPATAVHRLRTLDAIKAFEDGLDAYEEIEYARAGQAFARAAELDPRNPLPLAFESRTALLSRQDPDAMALGDDALRLITDRTPRQDALFTRAVAAEAARDFPAAEAHYKELVELSAQNPEWRLELAGFYERTGRPKEAIELNHQVLAADSGLIGAHLNLCRLYNPGELAVAKQHGEAARDAFRELGSRSGEAQALFCLADVLRRGSSEDRQQATALAEAAIDVFKEPDYEYNLARAYNYAATAIGNQRRFADAASLWEKSLAAARQLKNRGLESLVLMNLGVAHESLGDEGKALDYYQAGATLFQTLGQEQRAAGLQANAAAIRIEYGDDPEEGLREIRNARVVASSLGMADFEVLALQLEGVYSRNLGRQEEATHLLNMALNLARDRNLDRQRLQLLVDLARVEFERGAYASALARLQEATVADAGPEALIWLARVRARLGEFDEARSGLDEAARRIQQSAESGQLPVLHLAVGELAYETNRLGDARTAFEAASALWVDELPNAASVEGRAYLGLLDAATGQPRLGRTRVQQSLAKAQRMRRPLLEARCRTFLARIMVAESAYPGALAALDAIPADDSEQSIGLEMRAGVYYWRSRALMGRGDAASGREARAQAVQTLEALRRSVPEPDRKAFVLRPDIRAILE